MFINNWHCAALPSVKNLTVVAVSSRSITLKWNVSQGYNIIATTGQEMILLTFSDIPFQLMIPWSLLHNFTFYTRQREHHSQLLYTQSLKQSTLWGTFKFNSSITYPFVPKHSITAPQLLLHMESIQMKSMSWQVNISLIRLKAYSVWLIVYYLWLAN